VHSRIEALRTEKPASPLERFARCYWHEHRSLPLQLSFRETAHADNTGEQIGGDFNRQQKIACG